MVKNGVVTKIIWSLLLIGNSLYAQEIIDDEKIFYNANLLSLYHKHEKALSLYLKLAEKYPDNSNIQYLTGISYLHIPGEKIKAIPYLEKASQNVSRKYKKELFQETRAPLEAILFLGRAYQINNELNKALAAYTSYKKMLRKKQSKNLVERWIRSCETARKMMNNPGDVEFVFPELFKMGRMVYHPAISGNGGKMVFMMDTKYYHAVYFTKYENGAWTNPKNITMDIESDGFYEVSSLNYDGTILFLTVPRKSQKDIFISRHEGNRWGKAVPLEGKVNSLHNEVFASLSPDGHILYFVSDRSGGPGSLDIFTATLSSERKWDNIEPLPGPINTPYDEQSAILTPDGKKLFFSSNGHPGMGGFDVFVSKYENGAWQEPVNLGYPLNTTDDDLYFSPLDHGFKGYITRRFIEKEIKSYIASVEFFSPEHPRPVALSGNLILPPNQILPADIKINIKDITGKVTTLTPYISKDGTFYTKLPAGTYRITVNGKGITPYSRMIVLQKEDRVKNLEIPLTYTAPEQRVNKEMYIISPVYFDFNKFTLTSSARLKLDKMADILKVLPNVQVSIEGHTDAIGSCSYNRKLSLKRANSVKNHLVSRGVSSSRLVVIGYGESRPVTINKNPDGTDNPTGRHFNRRVEFSMKGNTADQIQVKYNIPPELLIKK